MRLLLNIETILSVIFQAGVMIVLRRIYYTHGMKSKAWIVIGIAFLVLLIKWIYGAYIIYYFIYPIMLPMLKYEALTALTAILLFIGFYTLHRELAAGEKFYKFIKQSMSINRNIIPEPKISNDFTERLNLKGK